ncbi:MAG: glutamate--tRNA ligase [Gammaproteobacteria bacterium]
MSSTPDSSPVTTRFAPSPTGLLHVGNARTALFNWLAAGASGGRFILRVEDTDAERSRAEHAEALMRDLRWLGLDWREGPDGGGGKGPYRQSERGAVYDAHYAKLEADDRVYPCYCSPEELALSRKVQRSSGQAPRYAGTCAHLSAEDRARREAEGRVPTLRFRVPKGERVEFEDMVRGAQVFNSDDIGDFIIRKADGSPAFFFCNAVDDALMGVDLVLRGEDHLTNTPRQMMILEALGLPVPEYGHISLVLGDDGAPLSKRNGSRSLADLRAEGWLPDAVMNHLTRLGHTFSEEPGYLPAAELAARFDTTRLVKAPARYDDHQLIHWQKEALAALSADAFEAWLGDVIDPVPGDDRGRFAVAIRENVVLPGEAADWVRRIYGDSLDRAEDAATMEAEAGAGFYQAALDCLDPGQEFKTFSKAVGKAAGVKGKGLFMPLRASLTGVLHGPQMGDLFALLGPERVRARLEAAYQRCSAA